MAHLRPLRWLFFINLLVVGFLIGYKIYLNVYERDFEAVHARQIERIQDRLRGRESYSFAVVGNINNSVGIFERKIVPMLNAADVDFVVSAGNAVSGGGEDKYRALYRSLGHLRIPYVLTFGENENSGLGDLRFYEHFGPYVFAFSVAGSRFVFLDSTGKTSPAWQLRWLRDRLDLGTARHTFLFSGHPLLPVDKSLFFDDKDNYLQPRLRRAIASLSANRNVDAVFSANLPLFDRQIREGTAYVTTGGAGGLILNNQTSYYHFVKVTVADGDAVSVSPVRLDIGQHPVLKTIESFWFFSHSLFYVGYLNFILLVCALTIAAIWLYARVFTERDYYPAFDIDTSWYRQRRFRVAMLTNNYLPFVGGVPLSIERLRRGLAALGHRVFLVAPGYGPSTPDEPRILRAPTLMAFGPRREFRIANICARRIRRGVRRFGPDVIHVHHPFWLGSLGLFLARRLNVPVVYTYHTRLEHYAHYVPLPSVLFRNLISHYLVKRFANKCDAVIVPTYSAKEYLRLIGIKSEIFIQATSIDQAAYKTVDPARVSCLREQLGIGDERVLISVSRLSQEKNIDFMLDALARLKQGKAPPFRLLLVGDGEQRERLQARVNTLGLAGNVLFLGSVTPEDLPVYYALADIFVFASKSETQGMVIAEAMAAGLPIVAIRSSGIDDVIREGVDGFKTRDEPSHWLEAVRTLLGDESLRTRMANAAQAYAQRFDICSVADEVAGIYAHAMAIRARNLAGRRPRST